MLALALLAATWLFASDIHLDPVENRTAPAGGGTDSNLALVQSAIAEMRRIDPHPPVVVIGGDLVAHHIARDRVLPTIDEVAHLFDRAFPDAQFVLTLGNNDAPCGDYGVAPDSAFLRTVTHAWEPLVNRHGAAPQFARTFAHDGFYTARLPAANTEAVVVDDIPWSPHAHACGAGTDAGDAMLAELGHALTNGDGTRRWVVMHIPPGIDAFSTVQLAQRLAVIPLLDPGYRGRFETLVADPSHHVQLVLAAHIHRFAYRVLGAHGPHPVPLLSIPAISPVYYNGPSFLTVDVLADGTIRNAEEHSFARGAWIDAGGLRTLGLQAFTAPELLALQARLANDARLRATFGRIYDGDGHPEIDEGNWRAYWCAATELAVTPYKRCFGAGGYRIVTQRGLIVLGVVLGACAGALIATVVLIRRRA